MIYTDEPQQIEPSFRRYMQIANVSPNKWTDAYLAAFADVSGFRFVTFDGGFRQFPGLNLYLIP